MEVIKNRLADVLQKKYDMEYAEMVHLISDAYALGTQDGKKQAKQEIIDMIKWEEKQ